MNKVRVESGFNAGYFSCGKARKERGSMPRHVTDRTMNSNAATRKIDKLKGAIAQLGERLPCTQEVGGSIPPGSTIFSGGSGGCRY